jgi:hypothetical protein
VDSLYTSCVLGLRPFALFNDIFAHLSKKRIRVSVVNSQCTRVAPLYTLLMMWNYLLKKKNFFLISLVCGVYKIVAKFLANILKMVVERIISKPQNAFIRGRQILDYVLIANDSRLRFRDPSVLCKLETEKAYNHANWEFMLYVLRMCGFGDK